ncbi:hypothetical protein [Paracoccus sediminis]|uniref:Uncharacterized protein n=1 Tax=Paracoccus sediminis TaxID=1214787 RepID=A0A238YJ87_9RHOB|nr:hypothetical protein [Paracoccus sediminis]SNR70781.1 hypothetical protein SAMN06265378_1197 [Paracoccus sediminis]
MDQNLYIARSRAAKIFKDRAGHANFRLNTIMVGLEGVRSGHINKPEELAVSWGPKNLDFAAKSAKGFAMDASLAFLVDALDTYLRNLAAYPSLVQNNKVESLLVGKFEIDKKGSRPAASKDIQDLISRIESVRQSPAELEECIRNFQRAHFGQRKRPSLRKRFVSVANHAATVRESYVSAVELLISWRNRHIHGDATEEISAETKKILKRDAKFFYDSHSHLDIERALSAYESRQSPSLKEMSSLISITHRSVASIDVGVIKKCEISKFALSAIAHSLHLRGGIEREVKDLWGKDCDRRYRKLSSILEPYGMTLLGERDPNQMINSLSSNVILELAKRSKDDAVQALRDSRRLEPAD